MLDTSIFRHLFNDDESLSAYLSNSAVSFEDVRRRVLLKERSENINIPDHYYRAIQKKGFQNIDSLGQIFSEGLYRLAEPYLELIDNRVYVQAPKQNEWQQLITYVPPLILQAAFLQKQRPLLTTDTDTLIDYFKTIIVPNTKHTALASPNIGQLRNFIALKKGFYDLHMHLNGSTETDIAWQYHLRKPKKIYYDFKIAFHNQLVKEQMEQESHLLTPEKYYRLLRVAQKIRTVLSHFIFGRQFNNVNGLNREIFLKDLLDEHSNVIIPYSIGHPFANLLGLSRNTQYLMSAEALMYILAIDYISAHPNKILTNLFHFYILILGLSNRLLVQQKHQNGFDEFQKLTLNRLRDYSEQEYLARFLQMHGNDFNYIGFLEGRFSPKGNEKESLELLKEIESGWADLEKEIITYLNSDGLVTGRPVSVKAPKLSLIAHFIKRPENLKYKEIRHKDLRLDVWKKARVLSYLRKNQPRYSKRIAGIDAASNEFDAPPEVFAPAFRMLRRKGFRHFTYHAGEDFYHIISGLRAIIEAIEYCEMKPTDRIGHATATGISVTQWADLLGGKVLIKKGEWLDNLLFAYHLILRSDIEEMKSLLPNIESEVQRLAHYIYRKSYHIDLLISAWSLRKYCPILWLHDLSSIDARSKRVFDDHEWNAIKKLKQKYGDCNELIELYHLPDCRLRYEELFELNIIELFKPVDIERLQLAVLQIMNEKEVVIETLPTSNIRIGIHKDYSTYQLWNWIKWEHEKKPIPPIIIGTDDTGIFATNIYNEFANIYCHLTYGKKFSHNKTMEVIRRLYDNGEIYKFE